MDIPSKIHKILEDKRYFMFLYIDNMNTGMTLEEVYDKSIADVREYAPKYTPYKNWETFRVTFSRFKGDLSFEWWNCKKKYYAPKHIIEAVTVGIDKLYFENYKKHYNQKKAYDDTVKHIQIYFPKYLPYRNFHSFVSAQSSKRKRTKRKKS